VSKLDGFCSQQKKLFIFSVLANSIETALGKDFAGFTVFVIIRFLVLILLKAFAVADYRALS
jgi:hypothetical protein